MYSGGSGLGVSFKKKRNVMDWCLTQKIYIGHFHQGKTTRSFLWAEHPLRGVCRGNGRLQRDLLGKPEKLPWLSREPLFQRDRGAAKFLIPHILTFSFRGDASRRRREFWRGKSKGECLSLCFVFLSKVKCLSFVSAFLQLYENCNRRPAILIKIMLHYLLGSNITIGHIVYCKLCQQTISDDQMHLVVS